MKSSKKSTSRGEVKNEPSPQEINMLVALFNQARYAEMETHARKMVVRFPLHGFFWKAIGTALLQQGRNEEALAPLQRAAELAQGDAQPYNNLGNTFVKLGRLSEAEASYAQALKLDPGFVEAHHNLGNTLLKLGRLFEAEASYRRALLLKPGAAEMHNSLGNALLEQGRLNEAEACYRQALALKPVFIEAHTNLGSTLHEQGRLSEAEASYKLALQIDCQCSKALFGLGRLRMESGEMEKADGLFLQALEANPGNLETRFHLAHLKKTKAEDANFLTLLEYQEKAHNNNHPLPLKEAISLHFALGKCYDDIGAYEKAFPHFLKGCKLKRAASDYNPDQTTQQFSKIMRTFDQAAIDRLRGSGNPSGLPIFVLGMPRSGTTLVEQIVASHPNVYGGGELPFLLNITQLDNAGAVNTIDSVAIKKSIFAWGTEYIAKLRQCSTNAQHITDKMPTNFLAVGLIHLMLPNAKIIHVKRNPADTCLSCFTQLFTRGQEHTYDMTELGRYYVDYARLMAHWHSVLPVDAFLEVTYEDMVADHEAQARRLIEYCGLEWNDACLDFNKNARPVQTASVAQVRKPMYKSSVERWRHYEKFLDPLLDALGDLAPCR